MGLRKFFVISLLVISTRALKVKRKSPTEAKKNKESKEDGPKVKTPNLPGSRSRALCMARPRPPYLIRKFSIAGAPTPPYFVTHKIWTAARPRGGGGAPAP
ncbi:hypothetical protein PIB30_048228 [Stylosanthes scabra]|uniref:Secreted protein n=1 Tax=Stylosanthes scabra TaxID=79078 RepID=A0ABU6VH23_9FABA|nr:hypothetical protein [Stylosanthes scabra]